ncbi:cysteine-rich CWC family protein [Shewanella waksmanii]|uniref:cysteine-rich CWC family protein n=1 Tax=Shewanella waksmanii TaxID=213783 RepID=UPI003735485D
MPVTTCPLCQQHNQCAIANQLPAQQCWCMQQPFPDKQAISVNLPANQCICQQCVQQLLLEQQQGIKRLD